MKNLWSHGLCLFLGVLGGEIRLEEWKKNLFRPKKGMIYWKVQEEEGFYFWADAHRSCFLSSYPVWVQKISGGVILASQEESAPRGGRLVKNVTHWPLCFGAWEPQSPSSPLP